MNAIAVRLVWPLMAMMCVACNERDSNEASASASATATAERLVITELAAGDGAAIAAGSVAVVHYTGWLYDTGATDNKGKQFDSSVDRKQPFRFVLGRGDVIKGWDQGVEGMKVGGKRRLVIPAALAYGSRGAGGVIPPGAALVFDVELLGIESEPPARE
jgi:FKBP-type peptidyl-prolyl cis-trans isomerase